MHCKTTREMLQDWFDLAGGGPMPPVAAAHIRECAPCRDFVRQWDRIELSLQALRDSAPAPSPDFRISLEAPPARARQERYRRSPVIYARWAAATAAAIAALGITYALTRGPLPTQNPNSVAIIQPARPNGYVARPRPLNADLPLANTR